MRQLLFLRSVGILLIAFLGFYPTACSNKATAPNDTSIPTPTPTNGAIVSILAGGGPCCGVNGTGTAASFYCPKGVAVDSSGNVYVSDANNDIRKITSGGVVTTLAGSGFAGFANGTGAAASFYDPIGIGVDTVIVGNIYVADGSNDLIRTITSGGVVSTMEGCDGCCGSDQNGPPAFFCGPEGLAVDSSGNVYVGDGYNLIRKISPWMGGGVTTLAGSAGVTGATNGTGTAALFNNPLGVAVDTSGNVYVADDRNNLIRKITPGGAVSTLAGSAGVTGSTNGTGTAALFNDPRGVAVDSSGNVYVGDYGNNLIRKISAGGMVSTLANVATDPWGVTVDSSGNVYVAASGTGLILKIQQY